MIIGKKKQLMQSQVQKRKTLEFRSRFIRSPLSLSKLQALIEAYTWRLRVSRTPLIALLNSNNKYNSYIHRTSKHAWLYEPWSSQNARSIIYLQMLQFEKSGKSAFFGVPVSWPIWPYWFLRHIPILPAKLKTLRLICISFLVYCDPYGKNPKKALHSSAKALRTPNQTLIPSAHPEASAYQGSCWPGFPFSCSMLHCPVAGADTQQW